MKPTIKNISLLLCVAATLASCYRKPLSDTCICNNTLSIPIDIDWETSGVDVQNVSVLFYDSEDGSLQYEHTYEHNSSEIQSYVSLPEGEYTAVVFNELRDQIDYLSCVDHENLSTLKFESYGDDPLRSRTATRTYVKQSGDLAVKVIEGIKVTEDMILEAQTISSDDSGSKSSDYSAATKATVESLTSVVPLKKNTTIVITAHIENLYYARMPSLVDLTNLADGYYVYGDKNSSSTSTLQFTMGNPVYYDGSQFDGTISTTVTAFGTLEDRLSTSSHDDSTPILLDILFQLIDAEPYTEDNLVADVTDTIVFAEQSDGSVVMTIETGFDRALIEVIPDGSAGDSGFGSSVEEWEDVEVELFN